MLKRSSLYLIGGACVLGVAVTSVQSTLLAGSPQRVAIVSTPVANLPAPAGSESAPATQTSSPAAPAAPTPEPAQAPSPMPASDTLGSAAEQARTVAPAAVRTSPRSTTQAVSRATPSKTTATKTSTTKAPSGTIKAYPNCDALNADYPHGVARVGGRDLVKGVARSPQPRYYVSDALYALNPDRDRDKDGVACEQA